MEARTVFPPSPGLTPFGRTTIVPVCPDYGPSEFFRVGLVFSSERMMKTYSVKAGEIERRWFVVDAEGKVLGRIATEIARILRGKHKPTYTPHLDTGDFVIVVNADKVQLTGNKADQKTYFKHTGYMGHE